MAAVVASRDGEEALLGGGHAAVVVVEERTVTPSTASSSPPPKRAETTAERRRRRAMLSLLIAGAVSCAVVAAVCRKLMYDSFGDRYTFFRQQLTNLLYDIWASAVVIYKLCFTDDITRRMRRFPMIKFAFIALLDGGADFLGSVGGVNTPGNWQTLLQQLLIPCTMLVSYLVLRSRFKRVELLGALMIIGGSTVAVVPDLSGGNTGKSSHVRWYSVLLYAASQLPTAASTVYKEKAFKDAALDVFYLTAMVSWTQLFLSWVFVPLLALPGFGGVPMHEIPSTMRDGFYCFLGHTDVPVYSLGEVVGHCSPFVTKVTMLFSTTGFCAGIMQLLITKRGSAVLTVLVTAIALPIANLAFSVEFVMGPGSVEPFSWYDVGGLALVLAGFVTYRLNHIRGTHVAGKPGYTGAAASADASSYGSLDDEDDDDDDEFGDSSSTGGLLDREPGADAR